AVTHVASPDGHRVPTASADGLVRVWDCAPESPLPGVYLEQGKTLKISQVSPDGRRVAIRQDGPYHNLGGFPQGTWPPPGPPAGGATQEVVLLIDPASSAPVGKPIDLSHPQSRDYQSWVAFSPDSQRLLVFPTVDPVRIRSATTGE